MPNGIYPYLYQIAGAEVEFIRTDQRHDRVSRNHLYYRCFRDTDIPTLMSVIDATQVAGFRRLLDRAVRQDEARRAPYRERR